MKVIEENGVVHEELKSFDELEKFLLNKKSFIIKDTSLGMAYRYIIKILRNNNITHCTAYFSISLQRALLAIIIFIITFFCFFYLSAGTTTLFFKYNIDTNFPSLTNNQNAKFYKELFLDEQKNELERDNSTDHDTVLRDENGNIISYTPKLNPYRAWYTSDFSFMYKDTIYVLKESFFLLFFVIISLFLATKATLFFARKYIFIATEYVIVKKIFSNSIEFLHTKE